MKRDRITILPGLPPLRAVEPHTRCNPEFVDYTGMVIGKLTVIGIRADCSTRAHWACQCQCGNYVSRPSKSLRKMLNGSNTARPECDDCYFGGV